MRPPSRQLAPGARIARPPPLGRQGAAPGDQRAPPSPLPLPLRPKSGQRKTEPPPKRPLHPGCGGIAAEAGARTPCLLPADGGPAASGTAQTERPLQRPARGRRGRGPGRGGPPPLPSPPRRIDPLAADRAAPDARGHPATPTETTDGRPTPDGAGRWRAVGQHPHPPPTSPPPA